MFQEGGLGGLLEVVLEVVDVVLLRLDHFEVVFAFVDGAVAEGPEDLDDGDLDVADQVDDLLQDFVFVADQFFAVGGQVGFELVDFALVLFPFGQDFAHQFPVFVHFVLEVCLLRQHQLRLVVDNGVADLFLKLFVVFFYFCVDLNQDVSFVFELVAEFFVVLYFGDDALCDF